ncbi:MAG: crotonase/enoyl-CoA hydratase family protein [Gammaproteobacteria bacterium]|nr:crotonase/enoyl-CoA hydratase family protein [Gammaproteobacteria bacterium]
MDDRVRIETEGALARVVLTRAQAHNGVDFAMIDALVGAAKALRKARDLRAAILHGEGPSFCAGLDFKGVLGKPLSAAVGVAQLYKPWRNKFQEVNLIWRELPVPVIAAIHGNCFGAGIQLALGADIRIAAPDARLSVMEAKWGLVPDMGGAALLRELLPLDIAKELVMTGRILSGAEAHELGLVTHIAADPLAAARELAGEIAMRSPDAVAAGKFLLQEAWSGSEYGALAAERRWQRRVIGRENQRIAVANNMKKERRPFGLRRF